MCGKRRINFNQSWKSNKMFHLILSIRWLRRSCMSTSIMSEPLLRFVFALMPSLADLLDTPTSTSKAPRMPNVLWTPSTSLPFLANRAVSCGVSETPLFAGMFFFFLKTCCQKNNILFSLCVFPLLFALRIADSLSSWQALSFHEL